MAAVQNDKLFISDANYDLRFASTSPDNRLLSLVACEPGNDMGYLFVQSSFLRELDMTAEISDNVTGAPVWYDPTPVPVELN